MRFVKERRVSKKKERSNKNRDMIYARFGGYFCVPFFFYGPLRYTSRQQVCVPDNRIKVFWIETAENMLTDKESKVKALQKTYPRRLQLSYKCALLVTCTLIWLYQKIFKKKTIITEFWTATKADLHLYSTDVNFAYWKQIFFPSKVQGNYSQSNLLKCGIAPFSQNSKGAPKWQQP